MLYFPTGTVISKPSVCATGNDNKSEFLLLRTLMRGKRRAENVTKRYDLIYVVLKSLFLYSVQTFINLDERSS